MLTWEPWKPPGYPIQEDPIHNPWVIVDPISGMTGYQLWLNTQPISEEDFRALLRALRSGKDEDE